jgi:hypothetical protein
MIGFGSMTTEYDVDSYVAKEGRALVASGIITSWSYSDIGDGNMAL